MPRERAVQALRRSTREPEAFASFYDEHAETLLAYLAKRVFDADAALDLTAETFAQAYLARSRFRGSTDAAAAAWLYRIAKRQLARYFRKGRAARKALMRLGIEAPHLDADQQARIEELEDPEYPTRELTTVVRVDDVLKGSVRAQLVAVETLELAFGGPALPDWRKPGTRVLLFLSPSREPETGEVYIPANTNYSQTAYVIKGQDITAAVDDPLSERIAALSLPEVRQAVRVKP